MSKLYSEKEAAEMLGMTPRMLADRRRTGRISAIKDGHLIAYTAAHLTEYQKNHQRRSTASIEELDPELLIRVLRKRLEK
ncbi:MAG: hypothetical protein J0I19_17380 [Alphaproteobacteria bacterium]|nr:hypothetical protein [Alphaproteobacteria bacterium]